MSGVQCKLAGLNERKGTTFPMYLVMRKRRVERVNRKYLEWPLTEKCTQYRNFNLST